MVSKNDVIDIFDNHMIVLNAIVKYLSCLMGNKAMPMIWYRTIRFRSTYTKSHETNLFNWLIDTPIVYDNLRAKCRSYVSMTQGIMGKDCRSHLSQKTTASQGLTCQILYQKGFTEPYQEHQIANDIYNWL